MLRKSDIDKKLDKYIRQNLGKGHSKASIKNILVKHGYDESYVEKSIRKQTEISFVNRLSIVTIMLFLAIIAIANFKIIDSGLTGFVVGEEAIDQYLILDLQYENYTLILNNVRLLEAQGIIGDFENTGFLIVLSGENGRLDSFYQEFNEGNNLVYVKYNISIKKIGVYDKSNLLIEVELDKLI